MNNQLDLFAPPISTASLVVCRGCGATEWATRIDLRLQGWCSFDRDTSTDGFGYSWTACCAHPDCRKDQGL